MSDAPPLTAPPVPADKARFWADTITAFTTSGLSVRAFCSARGLEEKRFYTWRRNLGLSPVARPAPVADPPARVLPRDPKRERFWRTTMAWLTIPNLTVQDFRCRH